MLTWAQVYPWSLTVCCFRWGFFFFFCYFNLFLLNSCLDSYDFIIIISCLWSLWLLRRPILHLHFRGGDWRTGGNCHLETLPELGSSLVPSETWTQFKIVTDVFSAYSNQAAEFSILNVTGMTARRKDGHSSVYYLGSHPAPLHRQDCSHWCLPGVPDSWNELLYALFLKHGAKQTFNLSSSRAQVWLGKPLFYESMWRQDLNA